MTRQCLHVVLIAVFLIATALPLAADDANNPLKVIQKPTFWIAGQWNRILVQTPRDCGELAVDFPDELKLLDRWPYKQGDTRQRFYFRAIEPLADGELLFTSGSYRLTVPISVLSWEQVLEGEFAREIVPGYTWTGTLKLPRVFPMEASRERKSGRSYLTPEEFQEQKEGFSKHLRGQAKDNIETAENLEEIFSDLPESSVPRTIYVNNPVYQKVENPAKGCPVCGTKIFQGRSAFYPWVLDPDGHPFKVQCPECERWFPSNNFGEGDMTSGEFPDDGWGYFDEQGRPYSFVGYYLLQHYRGYNRPEVFSRYYLATDDRRWGRATALVLFRIAEQYLNLALNINQRNRYTRDALWAGRIPPQGTPPPSHATWFSPGFYLDGVWTIGREKQYAVAMERIWDYFETEDPVLLEFLQDHYHPEMKTMEDVRNFIETGYFRTVAQGVVDGSVDGNGPAEHGMALRLAQYLNTPKSIELAKWVFNNRSEGLRYYLSNQLFKDGAGYESPRYNNKHYEGILDVYELMARLKKLRPEQYRQADLPMLSDDPRFRDIFEHNLNMTLMSRTYANVGDDGDLAKTDPLPIDVGASLHNWHWISAFERWPENVNYARALWDAEKNAPIKRLRDADLREKVTEIIEREGPYMELPSQVLDGYEHVILRSGEGEHQRALWLRYGRLYGHFHHDMLTIGYEALKRTLLPEQGYNRGPDYRTEWDMNWGIHYCGRILGEGIDPEWQFSRHDGILTEFADAGWAKMATAAERFFNQTSAPDVYEIVEPMTSERTVALVDLDAEHSYAVSLFRMSGGTEHHLSFHGPRGTARATNLDLKPQETGTLAGPGVEYGQKWDSEWGKRNPSKLTFSFLYDVQRAQAKGPWSVQWDLENYPDVHLRLHGLGAEGSEVAFSKGKPPGGGDPYELQWVTRHARGDRPLNSKFVEVLEAYEGEPLITEVRRVGIAGADSAIAFQVIAGNRVDTIIRCADPARAVTTANGITMQGSFGIWSEEDGALQTVLVVDGTRIARGDREFTAPGPALEGTIVSVDYARPSIVVSPASDDIETLVGRYARIRNEIGNDVMHLIRDARAVADGVELVLDVSPRIAEAPVVGGNEASIESGLDLKFERLYYRGKTLASEDASATFKTNGVKKTAVYVHADDRTGESLHPEFTDADGDGTARYVIYDYGTGDSVRIPSVISYP